VLLARSLPVIMSLVSYLLKAKRSDLEGLRDAIASGAPITQVLDDHVNVAAKYPTYVKMRMSLVPAPFRERPRIIILIGPSGCGKSRWVRDNTPSSETFWANDTKETWFDGYAHQPIIYFDEFRGRFPLQDMLKLLDWHRLQLPVKGAIRIFMPLLSSSPLTPPGVSGIIFSIMRVLLLRGG